MIPSVATQFDRLRWKFRHFLLQEAGESECWNVDDHVYVAGLFSTASGIGQSARSCAEALELSGVNISRIDLSEGFGQADLKANENEHDFASRSLSKKGGTLIIHLNGPELERGLFLCRNWKGSGRRIIAAWVWELSDPPYSWKAATRFFDELWVPSTFTLKAMEQICDKPIRVVPYYLGDLSHFPETLKSHSGVRCLTLADGRSSFERKNILGAIEAYRKAKLPPGSTLTIKTRNLSSAREFESEIQGAVQSDSSITLLDISLSRSEILQLIAEHDILLSLHRAEGFGLPMAEAMAMGKAVIATAWSANMDFMDETSAMLIPCTMVPVVDKFRVYTMGGLHTWAEPNLAAAADALTRLGEDEQLRLRLGSAAKQKVMHLATGQHYVKALSGRE